MIKSLTYILIHYLSTQRKRTPQGLRWGLPCFQQCKTNVFFWMNSLFQPFSSPGDQSSVHNVLAVRTLPHHHSAEVERPLQVVGQQCPLKAQHPPACQLVAAGERQGRLSSARLHPQRPCAVVPRPWVQGVGWATWDTLGTRPVNVWDLRMYSNASWASAFHHLGVTFQACFCGGALWRSFGFGRVWKEGLFGVSSVLWLGLCCVLFLQTGLFSDFPFMWFLSFSLQVSSPNSLFVALYRCNRRAGLRLAVSHGDNGSVTTW